ncbi:MAG: hypothetical protein HY392_01705, partial [Candidatus Diapherotrites archaeon]|nr:hypothetical protein [Candidatus Diapherotrites archaeon]
ITQTIEKPYSKQDIRRIEKAFSSIREARKNKDIQKYLKKTRKELKG